MRGDVGVVTFAFAAASMEKMAAAHRLRPLR
jgi:hypothetical protein